ncbi:MAG: DUF2071 domain-containing protein, partial [Chloroflexi bacterium]|nr:DUF2071 domain-containing protein [Chloroflexota bacterium]
IAGQNEPRSRLPWLMALNEEHVLFMHWPIPAEHLRPLVPTQMELDTYDGQAWLSLIPLRMGSLHLRWLPPIPGTSTIIQVGLRTYIHVNHEPAIYYLTQYADNDLYIWVARYLFQLPYHKARMTFSPQQAGFHFECHEPASGAEFVASYRPVGQPSPATPGSLEHFLLERYTLFSQSPAGKLYRGVVGHAPWPVQQIEVDIERNTIPSVMGLTLPPAAPLLHFSPGVHDIAWLVLPFSPQDD